MKKKIKKYSLISTSIIAMTTSICFPIMGAYNGVTPSSSNNVGSNVANENTTNSGNGKITVGGNTYQTIEEAIEDFIDKNVRQGQYLGDLDAATSTGDIKTVDLSQLIEVEDADRIERAYRRLDGSYTPNLEDAKRSHINTTVVKYLNNNGDEFDSQEEALKSMSYDYDRYTNEIGYYEISDYSQLDELGRPKTYLINPLNSEDQKVLKEIATRNAFISNKDTGFTLTRKVANASGVYENKKFEGMTTYGITQTADRIMNDVIDVIKNNLWLNSKVSAEPNGWYTQHGHHSFRWENRHNHDYTIGSTYSDILNDTDHLLDRNYKYNNHFVTTFPGFASNDIWKDYVVKQGEFGGQHVVFRLDDGYGKDGANNSTLRRYNYFNIFWDYDKGIFHDDGLYSLYFNQDSYDDLLRSNSTFRTQREKIANDVKNRVVSILTTEISRYTITRQEEIKNLIKQVGDAVYELMLEDILVHDNIGVSGVSNRGQVERTLDKIDAVIVSKLRSKLNVDVENQIFSFVKYDQQTREVLAATDVIYTIDYNGIPLYWLNEETLISPIYSSEEYKVNPLETTRNYYLELMRKDYTGTVSKFASGLINVSGSLEVSNTKSTGLKRETLDNYTNPNSKKANFPLSTTIGGSFAQDVKLFDEDIYSQNGITEKNLEVSLLRREDQDHSLLNNPYGTFMAIEDYNRTLRKYSEIKNPSQTLIDNVNENALKDTNEVISLYNQNGTPKNIKYGRHLTYDHKFNPSLTNGETRVYGSEEALQNEFKIENIDLPRKVYKFYDYNAELVDQQIIEPIDGKYNVSADQAYQNAINKINVAASTDYVYYRKEDDSLVLVDNEISNIYVLTIDTNERAIFTYGFASVNDLRDYVENYIIAEQGSGNGSITPNPDPTTPNPTPNKATSILNGFYVALAIVIIANLIVTSVIFVKKSRNNNVNLNIKK